MRNRPDPHAARRGLAMPDYVDPWYVVILFVVVGFPMAPPPRPVAPHVNPAFFPDMQSGTTSVVRSLYVCVNKHVTCVDM